LHIAQRFERLMETYRRPDGRRWTGQELDEATGGVVTRSYVTNLRKGRIDNPGYEKLRASPRSWVSRPSCGSRRGLSSVLERRISATIGEVSPGRRTASSRP